MPDTVIDEVARRRPGFDEANSVRIVLADSQAWAFPKPWLQIHAAFKDHKAVGTAPRITNGPELDALIDAIGEAQDADLILGATASLGTFLLTANYDLSDTDLDQLFAFRPGDPSSWGWGQEVMNVATGASGTRSFRGGSDSP
jgi:hypothetical protein